MKTVKKNVYYCDHCGKRGLSGYAMRKHELHCTMNPDRQCRMCGGNDIRKIVEEYKTRFTLVEAEHERGLYGYTEKVIEVNWIGEPITIEDVRKRVYGCPNCMLAIIRQCKFGYYFFKEAEFGSFDYQAEFAAAMAEKNREDEMNYLNI